MVRTLKSRPARSARRRSEGDAGAAPLPLHFGWRNSIRLPRDDYVRLDASDYSVDPSMIGRIVDVSADLHRVRVRCHGWPVADHARVWVRDITP